MMHGDGPLTMAQAVGDAPVPSPAYVPGIDFDPSDPDDVESVRLATERDRHDRLVALERENAELRAYIADLEN